MSSEIVGDDYEVNISEMEDENRETEDDFKVGTRAKNEDDTYKIYCKFAIKMGFDVRKGNFRRGPDKIIHQREYLCACEGVSRASDDSELKKIKRLVTRTGCKAFVRFTKKNGVWAVSHLNNEHNHKMVEENEKQFLKINRKIDRVNGKIISSMVDAGITGTQTYSYFVKELGGSENVGFTQRDCQNFVNRRRLNMIERGDALTVIDRFKHCLVKDQMFYHSEELDEDGRLANFFWRDGVSKLDYDIFGDVVIFDTTYRTNKYNMIFAPFIGVNHHRKTVLFACAFLLDETTESFTWLFETFLEAMSYHPPKTIFTDQCQAMANAIKKVFPGTRHRLCAWHISKNAVQRLGSLYSNSEFRGLFNNCLYDCETEEEFNSVWSEMITKFNLSQNKWLQMLYKLREKWCPGFSFDTFTLRIQSTQRSESMNNVFHLMSKKTTNLTEFYEHYEDQCEKMRSDERNENFRCKTGTPQVAVRGSKILKQAASVYTRTVYYLFSQEFMSSLIVHLQQTSIVDTLYTYQAEDEALKRIYFVEFNSSNCVVSCTRKLFESVGWLCRHALKVLNLWNCTIIPEQYILNRWTKFAKKGGRSENDNRDSISEEKSSLTLNRNSLMQQAYRSINQLVATEEGKKVAKRKLDELQVEAERLEAMNVDCIDVTERSGDTPDISSHTIVFNPPRVREKGVTNARMKSQLEKKNRKKNAKGQGRKNNAHNGAQDYGLSQDAGTSYIATVDSLKTSCHATTMEEDLTSSYGMAEPNLTFTEMLQQVSGGPQCDSLV